MPTTSPTSVLLTGFEPFGGDEANPSWPAVQGAARLLADRSPGLVVSTALLPVEFGRSAAELRAAVARATPDLVVCTGLAGGADAVRVERVAVNLDDARIPDGAGRQPVDEPVVPGGPVAWLATLPVKAVVAALRAEGVPALVSGSAGSYVCNHVFAALMAHLAAAPPPAARGGFVHLPWASELPRPAGPPHLPLADLARALAVVVETSLATGADRREPGGSLH